MPLSILRENEFQHAPRFQLWTDALCFREMAKQTSNAYLQSMCVRNAVLSAWTTLEMACCDALGIPRLKDDFRRSLDDEFDNKNIPRLDFSSGLWQHINSTVKEHRRTFTHYGVKLSDRFPPLPIAEGAIAKIREAIHDIYARLGKQAPAWVDFDQSQGWPVQGGIVTGNLHVTLSDVGATPDTPGVVNIVLVTPQGEERPTRYLRPSASDHEIFWWVEDYLGKLNTPFRAIRVYRGETLIHEERFEAR